MDDWAAMVNLNLTDHEQRIRSLEEPSIDLMGPEYAMPGELDVAAGAHRRIEPWPETAKRQLAQLEQRVAHLEMMMAKLLKP